VTRRPRACVDRRLEPVEHLRRLGPHDVAHLVDHVLTAAQNRAHPIDLPSIIAGCTVSTQQLGSIAANTLVRGEANSDALLRETLARCSSPPP
jgi:hypothetical protein